MEVHEGVFGSQGLELVLRSSKFITCLLLEVLGDLLSEALIGVEAGADGRTSLRDLVDVLEGLGDAFVTVAQLVDVTGELLAEGQRRGILGMSPSNLDDVVELGPLRIESVS